MKLLYEKNYLPNPVILEIASAIREPLDTEEGCGAEILHPNDDDTQPWQCTRDKGHTDWHIACLSDGSVVAVWTAD